MNKESLEILKLAGIALVLLSQAVFIAFKVVAIQAKKARKKSEVHSNPGNPGTVITKNGLCLQHHTDINTNKTNIKNIEKKIDKSAKENRDDFKTMFRKLDDIKDK